ncbi:MAG: ABC transporter ATP-binding protein [Lachnospiraceae bacterium]|nr:ABC transporter ATP-binding protein [Lachnospiraceae bacterium]
MIPKLEVKGVSCSYHRMEGETLALSHIEFTMNPGEFLAIAGPSGCGKSTLLSLICGLLSPDQGKILLDGKEVTRPGAGGRIGYMLQKDHLFEWRSILSNACLGPELSGSLTSERKEEIAGMLSDYGLGAFLHSRPSELSGGMRQRAALIRTLALKPDLLLLDEPFSALDYQTRLAVSDDISTIIRSANKTAILVTHDLSEAISIADRVLVLTKRPGQVKAIVPIRFESEKGRTASPLERRNLPEFAGYFNQLWKEIQTHE